MFHKNRAGLRHIGPEALSLAGRYLTSSYGGFKNRDLFGKVGTHCMFIGYSRSGHSLIGALLDAHPAIVIANELGLPEYVRAHFSRQQILHLLLENARSFAESGCWPGRYGYAVPGQWQGKFRSLKVVGDKQGEGAVLRLRARPWLLPRLRTVLGGRMKFIHVIRNPFDTVTRMHIKTGRTSLLNSIDYYFSLCATVSDIKTQIADCDLIEVKHESFIDSPKTHLRDVCTFLGVDAPGVYLSDCSRIVSKTTHKSRDDLPWDRKSIEIVENKLQGFPFLTGYVHGGS